MNKTLKYILIIFALLIIFLIVAGFIIYNFIPIKITTLCLSDKNIEEIDKACSNNQECLDYIKNNIGGTQEYMNDIPEFLQPKIQELTEQTIYCESKCKVKQIQVMYIIGGKQIEELEKVETCDGQEFEIKVYVKEIIKALKQIDNYNN